MADKRLYRSSRDKMVCGVCGGIAEYFNIDATIVRLVAVFLPGFGLFAYIIGAVIIPENPII